MSPLHSPPLPLHNSQAHQTVPRSSLPPSPLRLFVRRLTHLHTQLSLCSSSLNSLPAAWLPSDQQPRLPSHISRVGHVSPSHLSTSSASLPFPSRFPLQHLSAPRPTEHPSFPSLHLALKHLYPPDATEPFPLPSLHPTLQHWLPAQSSSEQSKQMAGSSLGLPVRGQPPPPPPSSPHFPCVADAYRSVNAEGRATSRGAPALNPNLAWAGRGREVAGQALTQFRTRATHRGWASRRIGEGTPMVRS